MRERGRERESQRRKNNEEVEEQKISIKCFYWIINRREYELN